MLDSIFLSRYRIQRTLRECGLFSAFELQDIIGGQRGILFLYALEGRPPLDLACFRYRQRRMATVCGARIPPCRMGEAEGYFYVLLEIDDGASPLALPLADTALQELMATVFGDICACRRAGLRLYQLSPDLIWRDGGGRLFYLPPLYLHFPGFLDREDPDLDPAPELPSARELLLDADLYGFGRLVERFTIGKPAWEGFRSELLGDLLKKDSSLRPSPETVLAASPLADIPELARLDMAAETVPELPEAIKDQLGTLTRDYHNGENLWITLPGATGSRGLRALDHQVCRSRVFLVEHGVREWVVGERDPELRNPVMLFEDLSRPEELLSPLWEGKEPGRRRVFALVAGEGCDRWPALARRAEEILSEWSRLRHLDLPELSAIPSDPQHRWEKCNEEDRQLLELLALQDAPLSLELLGHFFPQAEDSFFDRMASLESAGLLRWHPGTDIATGRWGLIVELEDPALRQWIRARMDPDRRRQLHRLCADLFPAEGQAGAAGSVQRLHHLDGAGDWERLAAEGLRLFRKARVEGWSLVLEHLAARLRQEAVEPCLDLEGRRLVHSHLARGLVQQGELDAAADLLGEGLRSLTGNPRFLDELLDERSHRPAITGLGDPALLPAVSAVIRELAEIGETRGEFAWSIRVLARLLDAFSEELTAYERGLLLNEQAWLHYRMGEHERASERCEVALRLFDVTRHQAELGQTYNTLGAAQWALNRWSEAEAYYKRALTLRERAGDENRVAASLNNLGNLYRFTERFALAIDYFNRSMAIKKRLKNYPSYLISLYNVALINFELNDFKAARSQCQECLELNRLVGNIQLGAEVRGLLGEIDHVEGRPMEAVEHLRTAIATCREIEAHTDLATMLRRLLPVQLALGDLDGAGATIDEGLRVARESNRLEEARIRGYASDFHMEKGDRKAAIASLEKAADLFSTLDHYEELARLYSRMGLLHLEGGDEALARSSLQHATAIIERRQVKTMIAEWESLQLRLRQRLGHIVKRIESDGKLRLASIYRTLALMESEDPRGEGLDQILGLLREALGYRNARLARVLADGVVEWHGGERDESPAADLMTFWNEHRESGVLQEQAIDGEAESAWRILLPLGAERGDALLLEREGEEPDAEERDFLQGLGRLLGRRPLVEEQSSTSPSPARRKGRRASQAAAEAPRLIGSGRDMQRLRKLIARVRDVGTTVLITGESGTGKEEVARAIHFESARREAPFLAVNCASIPETLLESTLFGHERGAFTGATHRHVGVFEEAAGGTVFLDEIGEMGADMQAKLLRVLQSKEFTRVGGTQALKSDVRILTATNRDLEQEVKRHQFREDLFYRINVLRIQVAPLREKREDIQPLTEFFLAQAGSGQSGGAKRFAPEVMEIFMRHPWPGNIRQLQNVISSCVVLSRGQIIHREDLPEDFLETKVQSTNYQSLDELAELVVSSGDYSEESPLEESLLSAVAHHLVDRVGSKAKAARMLGISKPTLYRRLRVYDTIRSGNRSD